MNHTIQSIAAKARVSQAGITPIVIDDLNDWVG